MIQGRYVSQLREVLARFDPNRANRYFLFGSAARGKHFHDIDIAVVGNGAAGKNLSVLADQLYASHIPYKVDVVDFDHAEPDFQDFVREHEQMIWIY